MNVKGVIALAAAGGIGYYLYRYFTIQAALLNQYEVHLQSLTVRDLTTQLVTMDMVMLFLNKSKIEAEVQNMYGDIYMNNVKVGSFNETNNFVIGAMGEAPIPITVSFSPAQVLSNVVDFVLQAVKTSDLPIYVTGYVSVKSGFLKIGVPFSYNTSVKNYLAG